MINFLIGLFIGASLSQGKSRRQVGGIYLEPLGTHSSNPFADDPFEKQNTQVKMDASTTLPSAAAPLSEEE